MGSVIRREAEGELRALTIYDVAPDGMVLVPVGDEKFYPHLKPGEWAVVDPADLEPIHGELFAVSIRQPLECDGHKTSLVALHQKWMKVGRHQPRGEIAWVEGWNWFRAFGLPDPRAASMTFDQRLRAGVVRYSDGPYAPEELSLVGRVVGVMTASA